MAGSRRVVWAALGVAVGVLVVLAAVLIVPVARPPTSTSSSAPFSSAQLRVQALPRAIPLTFYGVGIEAVAPLSSGTVGLLQGTPITYLRFPDGTAGDSTDLVNDTGYTPGQNSSTQRAVNVSKFISTCQAIACSAIIQLPVEIDEPGTAAYEARYLVDSLHFQPAYWELGNEPGMWTCFGVPWADWGSGCDVTVTPTEYAAAVARYIPAVRAVDPGAQFVGLGGTDGPAWIGPLELEDGPNLSAISQHSYVDDLLPSPSTITPTNFFNGLTAFNSLPNLVNTARVAIAEACPTCSTQVFVTEMDSVSLGQPLAVYLPTFDNGVFFAAEMTQGLNDQVANIDPFTWQNPTDGLINSSGPSYRYLVESTFLDRMGRTDFNASTNDSTVYAALTGSGDRFELLVVNVNATDGANVSLEESGVSFSGSTQLWTWTPATSAPTEGAGPEDSSSWIALPPTSIAMLVGNATLSDAGPNA